MILTNINHKIKIDDNLFDIDKSSDNIYVSISLPLYWIQHVNNCEDCNSFYSKLKNESNEDWFIDYNGQYYKLEFLDNQYIGNGINTIMDSKIDMKKVDIPNINYTEYFKIQNVKLNIVSKDESIKISRNEKLECLLSKEDYISLPVDYKNKFFTPITKEFADMIINNPNTIEIDVEELKSIDLKIEVKKI